jgi:hypothetical protein
VVVDVEQPRREHVSDAVENLSVIPGELPPAAAGPRGEHPTVFESDESVGMVEI